MLRLSVLLAEWDLAQRYTLGEQDAKTSSGPFPLSFWISDAKKMNKVLATKSYLKR
jgi:hypothetical protein